MIYFIVQPISLNTMSLTFIIFSVIVHSDTLIDFVSLLGHCDPISQFSDTGIYLAIFLRFE